MADIAAQMSPDVAQRLTVELADKAQNQAKHGDASAANLPEIQGQPRRNRRGALPLRLPAWSAAIRRVIGAVL